MLCIPPSQLYGEDRVHIVQGGETLYSIGRAQGIRERDLERFVGDLMRHNGMTSSTLRVGQRLQIPSGTAAPLALAPQTQVRTEITEVDRTVLWPIAAYELNRMTGTLNGVVLTGTQAEPVRSLTRGFVVSAGPYRGFGKVVFVEVDGGYMYMYGGSESLSIKEGDFVSPGTELGKLGIDKTTNKPLLFLTVYKNNVPIDPSQAPRL